MINLEEIKQRVRIVDICKKEGIALRKQGKNYTGLCPFHNEKTPSFKINDANNFYKCFGCQRGGDVIEFYKDLFKLDYKQAINELRDLAGLDASETIYHNKPLAPKKVKPVLDINKIKKCLSKDELYLFDERSGIMLKNDQLRDSNDLAIRSVQNMRLQKNKEIFFELFYYCNKYYRKDVAFYSYLSDCRKLSARIIEEKEIFYIGDYDDVSKFLITYFKVSDLQRAGLFNEKGNLIFYNHRLIIPYKYKNEIVYLRGRCIGDPGKFCKYLGLINDPLNLNTPKRFYNTDVIGGLYQGERIYITEGEFDCILMEDIQYKSIGIPGVGNIPNTGWLQRLFPFKIYLMLDNDKAGKTLENKLQEFFNSHHKTLESKQIGKKDVTDLAKEII